MCVYVYFYTQQVLLSNRNLEIWGPFDR
jgi:hypothetical protein